MASAKDIEGANSFQEASEAISSISSTLEPSEEPPLEPPEELESTSLEETQEPLDLSQFLPEVPSVEELSLEDRAKSLEYDIPMPWGHELFE